MRLNRLLFLLACPLLAQIATNVTATCPAPGNVATVAWTAQTVSRVVARIGPAGTSLWPLVLGIDGGQSSALAPPDHSATFATTPGAAYFAYISAAELINDGYPYTQPITFSCISAPPSPPTPTPSPPPSQGVTITVDGKTIATGVTTLSFASSESVAIAMTPSEDGKTVVIQFAVAKVVP